MSKILAIDSSTEACSVALMDDGTGREVSGHNDQEDKKAYQKFQLAPRKHAELLLPMVDEVLTEANLSLADLDAIACCVGPGAFTGLRIAVSVAQGLAFASNLPCIAVSSLEMLAVSAFKQTDANICFSAIDARMQEVYFAIYEKQADQAMCLIGSEGVLKPADIDLTQWKDNEKFQPVFIGNGWFEYEFSQSTNELNGKRLDKQFPNAVDMLDIAQCSLKDKNILKPEELQPVYIRNNVAKKKAVKS